MRHNLRFVGTQSSAFTSTYVYGSDGTLDSVTTPTVDGIVSPDSLNPGQFLRTAFKYNSYGQLTVSGDQAGVLTSYTYGTSGFGKGYLAEVQHGSQPNNTPLVSSFTYNSVGRVIGVTDPRGETYTTFLNQLDQAVRSETPQISSAGNAVYYSVSEYDLNGNLEVSKISNISETGAVQSPSTIDTTYSYNILDMILSVVEPIESGVSRTTSFTYDLIYRPFETILPEGNRSSSDFDELSRPIKSYFGYDGTNISRSSALAQSEVFYDDNSNVIRSLDGRGNDSHFYFDAYDRLLKVEDRLPTNPNYTEYVYNAAGQVVQATRKGAKHTYTSLGDTFSFVADQILGQSQTEYDNIGRAYLSRVLAKDANGSDLGYSTYNTTSQDLGSGSAGWSTSRVQFRNNGQVLRTRDDLGYLTFYSYDSYNRLSEVADHGNAASMRNGDQYTYDANGNVTAIRAVLYDDVNPTSVAKDLTTYFYFDEINRLIEDESPPINGAALTRTYAYDSRSNLVKSVDRKGVTRRTEYDLLGRPVRHIEKDIAQRVIDPATGYVSTLVQDIAGRTVYDKNSNVRESIDTNGNRTYFRHDMAGRWLETQFPDSSGGGAHKTHAGTNSTSISAVSGTVFFQPSSPVYDGNSNLLAVTDANGTSTSFMYDENDLPVSESGAVASGNPFGIEGETGMEYVFDGLYRVVHGLTFDDNGGLTQTDSLFNTLGGLERQRQRVYDAHPSASFTDTGHVLSKFDESGRRYQRTNPGNLTATTWHFDQKHRPIETYLNRFDSSGDQLISEYAYLGGGLMHSRQTKYMKQNVGSYGAAIFPIVSNFTRDDLLRVTSVRHHREDGAIGMTTRLLGRYDYAYDANSMMRYEARWHESDNNGASTTPDEIDFYWYDSANRLEKAVYNVTGDALGAPIDLAGSGFNSFASIVETVNNAIFSDRVHYSRRRSGTRDSVNWNRGSASRTGPPVAPQDDSVAGPTQRTGYDTSDDPNADDGSPAADGGGSRHNYTVIGQVGLTHDHNRNVLADGTREFRYNYKNQLRRVWRKSDGDQDGAISKYREDAFGRRVYAETSWELSRRVYLDSRFELDIDMDADNDSQSMVYVDGGITSTHAAAPGQTDQKASWDSRIDRPETTNNESHYFDFLVDVPEAGEDVYLGFVAYDQFELHIFGGWYQLWDVGGTPVLIDSTNAATAGRRNIGIRAGLDAGVWVDGTRIMGGPTTILPRPLVRFGTHWPGGADDAPGLVLLENLCYVRSWLRSVSTEESIPTGPRVTTTFFDGPRPVTVREPITTNSSPAVVNFTEDATRADHTDGGGDSVDTITLPNGRRTTGQVIRPHADRTAYGEFGRVELEEEVPGVSIFIHVDGIGATTAQNRKTAPPTSNTPLLEVCWDTSTTTFDYQPYSGISDIAIYHGPGGGPEPDSPNAITALNNAPGTGTEAITTGAFFSVDTGTCACRDLNPSIPTTTVGTIETATGGEFDYFGGNLTDTKNGVIYTGGYDDTLPDGISFDHPTLWENDDPRATTKDGYQRGVEANPHTGPTTKNVYKGLNSESLAHRNALEKQEAEKMREYEERKACGRLDLYTVSSGSSASRAESDWFSEVVRSAGSYLAEDGIHLMGKLGENGLIILVAGPLAPAVIFVKEVAIPAVQGAGQILSEQGRQDLAQGIKDAIEAQDSHWHALMEGDTDAWGRETANFIELALLRGVRGAINCFVEGTLVWVLKDGMTLDEALRLLAMGAPIWAVAEPISIQSITAGVWVLSRHDSSDTAPLTFSRVEVAYTRTASNLVEVKSASTITGSTGTITATEEHPFWVTSANGRSIRLADATASGEAHTKVYSETGSKTTELAERGWAFAGDLRAGHQLSTPADGRSVTVASNQRLSTGPTTVYNLAVEGTSTYFVSPPDAPEHCIWVHNAKYGKKPSKSTIKENKAKGDAFEAKTEVELRKTQNVQPQITIKVKDGTRTRVDFAGIKKGLGQIALTECKSSVTAPLTSKQATAFPQIENSGGVVVGKGKAPFVGGTRIPPTRVRIIRPSRRE